MTLATAETICTSERAPRCGEDSVDGVDRWKIGLRGVALAALLAGCFFRLYSIDRHFYWNDEVATSLRIAGYQVSEIESELRNKQIVSVAEMQKYQSLGSTKTLSDTVRGLAQEEPQLAPLYFVLARQWVAAFGNSITVNRTFPAFLSLLTLPCVYFLCRDLFGSIDVGLMASALLAVSPAQVVFAQEARPYSLYVLMVLVSSILLLRALKTNSLASWTLYGLAVVGGLYTQVLFGAVAASHTIYVLVRERFAVSRRSVSYAVTSAIALAGFVPWILVILNSGAQGTSWTQTHQSLIDIVVRWSGITSRSFLDFGVAPSDPLAMKLALLPAIALLLVLMIYSIWYLLRTAKVEQWLFVVALVASVALPLLLLDFALGRRYGTTRYILPSLVGLQICVAYLLAGKLSGYRSFRKQSLAWHFVAIALMLTGILSCTVRSQAQTWWNKSPGTYGDYPLLAQIVNRSDQPVVYCYGPWRLTQMMCHQLDPAVHVQLLGDQKVPQLSDQFEQVFVFNPPADLQSHIARVYDVSLERSRGSLWKVSR